MDSSRYSSTRSPSQKSKGALPKPILQKFNARISENREAEEERAKERERERKQQIEDDTRGPTELDPPMRRASGNGRKASRQSPPTLNGIKRDGLLPEAVRFSNLPEPLPTPPPSATGGESSNSDSDDDTIVDLEAQVGRQRAKIQRLETDLESERQSRRDLQTEYNRLVDAQLQASVKNEQDSVDKLLAQIENIHRLIKQIRENEKDLQNQLDEKESELRDMRRQLSEARHTITEMESNSEKARRSDVEEGRRANDGKSGQTCVENDDVPKRTKDVKSTKKSQKQVKGKGGYQYELTRRWVGEK
ncbi:hypothetical protein MMC28_006688 [Mycoblastus sanguinarius]|nr:hypothetical protein [Mycoblastus sanguinarius]